MQALLTALLLLGSPEPAEPEPAQPVAQATSEYTDALARLREGLELIDADPERAAEQLSDGLVAIQDQAAQFAVDPEAHALRERSYLALAELELASNPDAARSTLDELVRVSRGAPTVVPDDPALAELLREREAELASRPKRDIVVVCSVPCRVYLDERRVGPDDLLALPTTSYRLWIMSTDGSVPEVRETVTLLDDFRPFIREFRAPTPISAVDLPRPTRSPTRALDLIFAGKTTMIVGGVGILVGGGLFVAGVAADGLGPSLTLVALAAATGTGSVVSLIVGGGVYGLGKAEARRAKRTSSLLPTLAIQRDGAQVGVRVRF
jgi:hypothetical protein